MSDSDDDCIDESGDKQTVYFKATDDIKDHGWGDLSLRLYQIKGVNWMISRYFRGHGCILGDEMGLGKTCQTIALMVYIHGQKKSAVQSLVVCPRSVLENWEQEVHRFSPGVSVQCYIGDKDKRNLLQQKIKSNISKGKHSVDILITTYEICLKDDTFLRSIPWHILVVDEAHRLKNKESLLYKTLNEWDIKHPVLLTGTPVQNNLQELYSLLSFVAPSTFPASRSERFVEKYNNIEKSKGVSELHSLLLPYLLRRTKSDVLKDLPKKTEVILYHDTSKLQKKLYKAILTKDIGAFESNISGYNVPQTRLMNILMQLRKCVNHPYLFDGVEPEPFELGEHLVEASGKLVLIDKMLDYLKSTGHKVLLFSQMTHMLDILQDYLGYRGYSYERLDGSVRGEERFLAVQNFNQNDETFVFLLSTRAGGQGLNLASADTVIFVDSDFNPQNDLQAAARAHRIGQKRAVKVVRLIGRHTVEEIILKRAEDKLKLTEKVIEEGQFSLGASKQSLITDDKVKLQDILKFGIDKLLSDEDDNVEIDFRKILGPTVSGEWQPEETKEGEEEEEDMEDEGNEDEIEATPQSMYVYEGKDYSKEPTAADRKVFEDLLSAEMAALEAKAGEERSLRKRQSTLLGPLPDVPGRSRKKLTPEELEERKKKRKEAAERRAKEAEEQELRRAQEQRRKRDELWKANSYTSCNIELEEEGEEDQSLGASLDEEEEEEDQGEETTRRDIRYVIGDVTHPKDNERKNNIIIHCADDSGRWGKGGLFSAISARSPQPENQYQLAGRMKDLCLGDCHLIAVDDVESREEGSDTLGLIIAQHRDKRNNLSGIKLSALRNGLERVYHIAKERKASVHLPRIGHDTPGFNWYGTEKLIKKHLAAKGIPTYIYYFPRKQQKRKATTTGDPPSKVRRDDSTDKPSTSPSSSSTASKSLPSLFSGVAAYVSPTALTKDVYKKYRRYILAYDGDVHSMVLDGTTHIVVNTVIGKEEVKDLIEKYPEIPVVTTEWIDDCLVKRKCLPVENYQMC